MDFKTKRGEELWKLVKDKLEDNPEQDPAHDSGHIRRVWKTGIEIGEEENADFEILEPALLFHDLVRPGSVEGEKNHATESAVEARPILENYHSENEIEKIVHAIKSHSLTDNVGQPSSLEAKIVYDADKLDGLGLIGIFRYGLMCGNRGMVSVESAEAYLKKIKYVLENRPLYTEYARNIARKRVDRSLELCSKILGRGIDV